MKKFFQRLAASSFLIMAMFSFAVPVHAQFSLLPVTSQDAVQCKSTMDTFEGAADPSKAIKADQDNILGCGINTGRISFAMLPFYITYITNFLLGLSGLICVLFIVIGGYRYVIGGLTEEKEKGKNTIKHALMGLGVALLSWTIVTVLINAVTG